MRASKSRPSLAGPRGPLVSDFFLFFSAVNQMQQEQRPPWVKECCFPFSENPIGNDFAGFLGGFFIDFFVLKNDSLPTTAQMCFWGILWGG